MAIRAYAFRIGREADLLDEDEWKEISSVLKDRSKWIMEYLRQTGCSIDEARREEPVGQAALDLYEALTGLRLDHPDQLWGLRLQDYGGLCPECSRPFRTPKAKLCAECGYCLPQGMTAGRLDDPIQ